MSKTIVILGANSGIAKAFSRLYAQTHDHLVLVGRNTDTLENLKADLTIRGAEKISTLEADLADLTQSKAIVQRIHDLAPHIDILLVAYGILGNHDQAIKDSLETEKILQVNFTSVATLLVEFYEHFKVQKQGTVAVISSVAGDRGRQSNYIYGAAKGGLSTFLQGYRHSLAPFGVHVLTIKPGFVDTPMTASFKKGLLWIKPEKAAQLIYKAIQNKKNEVYVPGFWKWIMAIIKSVPNVIFHKTKL